MKKVRSRFLLIWLILTCVFLSSCEMGSVLDSGVELRGDNGVGNGDGGDGSGDGDGFSVPAPDSNFNGFVASPYSQHSRNIYTEQFNREWASAEKLLLDMFQTITAEISNYQAPANYEELVNKSQGDKQAVADYYKGNTAIYGGNSAIYSKFSGAMFYTDPQTNARTAIHLLDSDNNEIFFVYARYKLNSDNDYTYVEAKEVEGAIGLFSEVEQKDLELQMYLRFGATVPQEITYQTGDILFFEEKPFQEGPPCQVSATPTSNPVEFVNDIYCLTTLTNKDDPEFENSLRTYLDASMAGGLLFTNYILENDLDFPGYKKLSVTPIEEGNDFISLLRFYDFDSQNAAASDHGKFFGLRSKGDIFKINNLKDTFVFITENNGVVRLRKNKIVELLDFLVVTTYEDEHLQKALLKIFGWDHILSDYEILSGPTGGGGTGSVAFMSTSSSLGITKSREYYGISEPLTPFKTGAVVWGGVELKHTGYGADGKPTFASSVMDNARSEFEAMAQGYSSEYKTSSNIMTLIKKLKDDRNQVFYINAHSARGVGGQDPMIIAETHDTMGAAVLIARIYELITGTLSLGTMTRIRANSKGSFDLLINLGVLASNVIGADNKKGILFLDTCFPGPQAASAASSFDLIFTGAEDDVTPSRTDVDYAYMAGISLDKETAGKTYIDVNRNLRYLDSIGSEVTLGKNIIWRNISQSTGSGFFNLNSLQALLPGGSCLDTCDWEWAKLHCDEENAGVCSPEVASEGTTELDHHPAHSDESAKMTYVRTRVSSGAMEMFPKIKRVTAGDESVIIEYSSLVEAVDAGLGVIPQNCKIPSTADGSGYKEVTQNWGATYRINGKDYGRILNIENVNVLNRESWNECGDPTKSSATAEFKGGYQTEIDAHDAWIAEVENDPDYQFLTVVANNSAPNGMGLWGNDNAETPIYQHEIATGNISAHGGYFDSVPQGQRNSFHRDAEPGVPDKFKKCRRLMIQGFTKEPSIFSVKIPCYRSAVDDDSSFLN